MGVAGKDWGEIFQWGAWGAVFNENKLKSEIFNEKKCLLTKMFSSVSLNPEFNYFKKMGWGLRIKKIYILWGFIEKSDF